MKENFNWDNFVLNNNNIMNYEFVANFNDDICTMDIIYNATKIKLCGADWCHVPKITIKGRDYHIDNFIIKVKSIGVNE